MKIKFYNSLTKTIESFPQKSEITIYSCGPTVYDFAHIGNLRTFLFEDLLIRTLKVFQYKIIHVRNLTDVDDKTIQRSIQQKLPLQEFTQHYINEFFNDLNELNFDQDSTTYLKATDFMPHSINLIKNLIAHNHAYETEDGVYFKINSFKKYGNFAELDLDNLQQGASGVDEDYSKEDFGDFVIWKKHKSEDGTIFWESPWGKGRAGWHTECAAIVSSSFPKGLDIHTGGIDLLFPHHTNEKAHIECLSSQQMARFWLHATHLLVDNKKMSKSLGNFYTLKDLKKQGFNPRIVRFYLQTGAHYRSSLNFTLEGLKGAESALKRIDNFIYELSHNPTQGNSAYLKEKFLEKISDDLNISAGLGELFTTINNYFLGEKFNSEQILQDLKDINNILGVLKFPQETILNEKTQHIFNLRVQARKEKNWKESDRLRDLLLEHNIEIRDTKDGTTIRKI